MFNGTIVCPESICANHTIPKAIILGFIFKILSHFPIVFVRIFGFLITQSFSDFVLGTYCGKRRCYPKKIFRNRPSLWYLFTILIRPQPNGSTLLTGLAEVQRLVKVSS